MKSTGIVRNVDNLGRIVLPIELRRTFHIEVGDPVELFVQGDKIILRRYQPGCIFCGKENNLRTFGDYKVCESCVSALQNKEEK